MNSDKEKLAAKRKLLVCKIEELIVILDQNDGQFWSTRFRQVAGKLKSGDDTGVRDFLASFGGNGSFNEFALEEGTWVKDKFIPDNEKIASASYFQDLIKTTRLLANEIASETEPSLLQNACLALSRLRHSKPVMITSGLALVYALLCLLLMR